MEDTVMIRKVIEIDKCWFENNIPGYYAKLARAYQYDGDVVIENKEGSIQLQFTLGEWQDLVEFIRKEMGEEKVKEG